jgi:putative transcriptional regulator
MNTDTLAGKLLVAMPGIGDPRFDRSVIFMCSHDIDHAMGLIVNKPKDEVTMSDVLEHLGIEADEDLAERAVLDGGPVHPDRGFVLHSEDFAAGDATQSIGPGIRLTATREVLNAVAGDHAPARFMLALGCAGWGAGQLEEELRTNSWLVVDANDAIIFGDTHADKWSAAIKSLGFEPSQLMGDVGSA